MRKWIIATAVLLTVPMVGAAAVIVAPPVQEQLVEGHTVFSVIQVRNTTGEAREEFAAAVAVLVREFTTFSNNAYTRFPGVLWFNDQYLVNPLTDSPPGPGSPLRYPCGAVIAVNSGDAVPLVGGVPAVPSTATYVESYRITDPNDVAWDVDKWSYDPDADPLTTNSFLMWSVAVGGVGNDQTSYHTPDNGVKQCSPTSDNTGCGTPLFPFVDDTPQRGYGGPDVFTQDPTYQDTMDNTTDTRLGDGEGRFRCNNFGDFAGMGPSVPTPADAKGAQYNAVLYFFLDDLTAFGGIKNHSAPSTDVSRCHPTTHPSPAQSWPCPGGNDAAEGNSHPYNPERQWPNQVSEGRNNHGGSSGCGAGDIGAGAQYEHATCNIDIYFGFAQAVRPAVGNYRVWDTEGKTAPYHCHEDMDTCNEEDFNSNL